MLRCLILALLLTLTAAAKPEPGKFEGIWKADKPYIVLTILSNNPPRGNVAWGEGAPEFYIQDVRIAKGALRFKTIEPNDGVVQYEMKIVSPSEATLSIAGRETLTLKRK